MFFDRMLNLALGPKNIHINTHKHIARRQCYLARREPLQARRCYFAYRVSSRLLILMPLTYLHAAKQLR